jgi:putative peptidoglycan lipid II flippase
MKRRPSLGSLEKIVHFVRAQPFARGSFILTATSGLSYALGLIRDRTLVGTFGASHELDAYQAAFIIPDLLFNLLVAGALTAAFIPVFTHLRTRNRHREASQLAGSLLCVGLLALLATGIVAALLAQPLAKLVAPGFHPQHQAVLANLTRLMLLSPVLFFISNLLGNMLVSTKRFLSYGLSPVLYNLGIITGILMFSSTLGIYSAVLGTLIGAALHMLVRILDLKRAGLKLVPSVRISPAFKKVLKLMLPRMVGLCAVQVQLWAFTALASTFGEGAVSITNLARNFQSFPVSLIGISFATSLFPLLAESAAVYSSSRYLKHLTHAIGATLAAVIPAALILYLVRYPLISLLLGTGEFDAGAVRSTAIVLGMYTLSIPTESINHLLSRAFYALHNTITPMIISIIGIGASIMSAYLLAPLFTVTSIPAGFAIGTALQTFLLLLVLRPHIRKAFTRP